LLPYFYPQTGGAETNCLALAKGMANLGHQVTVITTNTINENYEKSEVYEGIKIIRCRRFNNRYYMGFYPSLFGALLNTKSDIVHVHGFGFIWHDFCLMVKKLLTRHVVFINTPHGPFMANGQYSFRRRIFKNVFTFWQKFYLGFLYDGIIEVNPNQKNWIRNYGINNKKISYFPNGIYEKYFSAVDANDVIDLYGLGRKQVISFIGRFEQYKGLQDVIAAVKDLSVDNKTIKLMAMGNQGNYLTQIQEIITSQQLEKQVEVLVSPDNETIHKILSISEIFILPSSWEAFGISILEAMAMGNAIISTRTEGGKYLVKEEENGFLYEFGDVNDLKSLINKLLTNKKLLAKMRDVNIEKAKEFTWEKIIPEYNRYLSKLR
jgi:glycosyltransferase involved in cell wall biosynthesis